MFYIFHVDDRSLIQFQTLLAGFGCNQRESAIYLQSLQAGPATVQELAQVLGYNRVTVHSAVEQLLKKGFLFETRKGKRRLIAAEPPKGLKRICQRRERELQLLKSELDDAAALLDSLPAAAARPAIKFYEGVDGLKRMLEETLAAKGEILVFSYVEILAKLLPAGYLEDYFKRRAKRRISTRLIFPPCPFASRVNAKSVEYRIQVRLLAPNMKWRSGIFAWNDIVALLSYTQSRATCTIIENSDIAHFYRTVVFELAWSQASPA